MADWSRIEVEATVADYLDMLRLELRGEPPQQGGNPFFASRNEVEVSDRRNADYQLYRLFKFSEQPKLFMLPGSLRRSCRLDPVSYAARVA